MNTVINPYGALHQTILKEGVTMIFLLQEEITDGLKVFKAWFDTYFPYYGDVARLDGDNDGEPCESLPGGP